MAAQTATKNGFVIWGPSVADSASVLKAVQALKYLPSQFRLILPPVQPHEQASYEKLCGIIRRRGLKARVEFSGKQIDAAWQAVVATENQPTRSGYIFARTPQALASAILSRVRTAA
jgi:hypothetical protein